MEEARQLFQPVIIEGDEPLDLSEFPIGMAKERDWIIGDWFPKGEMTSIYGSGSAGKSLVSLQLLLSVASRMDWLGLQVDRPMHCIGVYCEDSIDELHRRLDCIRTAPEYGGLDLLKRVRLWPRVGKDSALVVVRGDQVLPGPFLPQLTRHLESYPADEEKLLILDTLSDVYLGDENTREKVNKFLKVHLMALALRTNTTPVILAHPSRTGQNTKDMLSGSTAWENAVRNRLAMFPHDAYDDIMVIKRLKSNYAKKGDELLVKWDNGRFIRTTGVPTVEEVEGDVLGRFLYDAIPLGEKMKVSDLLFAVMVHPEARNLFADIASEKRRRERLVALINEGVSFAGVEFNYTHNASQRSKHWVSASQIPSVFA